MFMFMLRGRVRHSPVMLGKFLTGYSLGYSPGPDDDEGLNSGRTTSHRSDRQ